MSKKILLKDFPTRAPKELNKEEVKLENDRLAREIGDLQHLLYAEKKHSVLVIFQGMDSSGKDGATRKVFKYCSPSGISAFSFKKPTEEEFAHDFLWRVHKQVPQKGQIQVFNRSHYEDILIQRVHKWISEAHVAKRMESINAFEKLLEFDNDTLILKFYMHISKEKQEQKLQERIDNPRKNWKHNQGDWEERKHWDRYMQCYEDVINWSSVPWHIIPVDQRWYRDHCIAIVVLKELKKLKMKLPVLE